MKIKDARAMYSVQLQKYQDKKLEISKQKKELEKKSQIDITNKDIYAEQMVQLDLSYGKVSERYDAYHKYMESLSTMHMAIANAESAKQQGEAVADAYEDMGKIYEVARRISKGDKVPPEDEKKLMEYSMEMYLAAKSAAMVNKNKDSEEHDSLWEDEEPAGEQVDPMEVADNTEVGMPGPAIEDETV